MKYPVLWAEREGLFQECRFSENFMKSGNHVMFQGIYPSVKVKTRT